MYRANEIIHLGAFVELLCVELYSQKLNILYNLYYTNMKY